jgi:hypothetical protein
MEMLLYFLADAAEKLRVDQALNNAVLISV